jgi:hypothetical protein
MQPNGRDTPHADPTWIIRQDFGPALTITLWKV